MDTGEMWIKRVEVSDLEERVTKELNDKHMGRCSCDRQAKPSDFCK